MHAGGGAKKGKAAAAVQRVDARKRLLLLKPPATLLLHLKRLQARGKINVHVAFTETLDMTPYCWINPSDETAGTDAKSSDAVTSADKQQSKHLYTLYAVVEHRGGAAGGHYVAHVRTAGAGGWALISDETVRPSSLPEVLKAQAYMLFYEQNSQPQS